MPYDVFDPKYVACAQRVVTVISESIVESFYTSLFASDEYLGDVIDGGANIGRHTAKLGLLLRGTPYRVVAVEPNAELHAVIRSNCHGEMVDNFVIDTHALNSVVRTDTFRIFSDAQVSQLSDLAVGGEELAKPHQHGKSPLREITVQCLRLRDLISRYSITPKFVKLDTEQTEYGIITESIDVIAEYGMSLSVETGSWSVPPGKMRDFYEACNSAGLLWVDCLGLPYTAKRFEHHYEGIYWNRFIVPREIYQKVDFVTPMWSLWCSILQLPLSHLLLCKEFRADILESI
jgi:FkbM family methyltransferase